jgi:LacI family transcriptional regulator, galactose operon repressor
MSSRLHATMRDVAALAGVSLKTVSRVVNGEPSVAPELAARVRRAVTELDYRPNLAASMLRRGGGRSWTIGLLVPDVADPFWARVHREVAEFAAARGAGVLAGSIEDDAGRERDLATAMASRRVDGLILAPAGIDQRYLAAEHAAGTALVFVDRAAGLPDADSVVSDDRAGSAAAVRHLLDAGHARIGYLGGRRGSAAAAERLAGYAEALSGAGLGQAPQLVREDLREAAAARAAAGDLLAAPAAASALYAASGPAAAGAMAALRERGLQHRIALVGFGDPPLADLLDPPLTAVDRDPAAVGRTAAEVLFARLDGDDGPPRRLVVPTRLVVRGSGEIRPH